MCCFFFVCFIFALSASDIRYLCCHLVCCDLPFRFGVGIRRLAKCCAVRVCKSCMIRLCRRCLRKITPFTSPRWKGIFERKKRGIPHEMQQKGMELCTGWLAGSSERWMMLLVLYLRCIRATSIQSELNQIPYSILASHMGPRARQLCALNFRIAVSIIAARPIFNDNHRGNRKPNIEPKSKIKKRKKACALSLVPHVHHVHWSPCVCNSMDIFCCCCLVLASLFT